MTPRKGHPETSLQKVRRERREVEARLRSERNRHREQLRARDERHRRELKSMVARMREAEGKVAKWRRASEGYLVGDDLLTLVDIVRAARRDDRREKAGIRVRSGR
jgi:hypothetical protein